MKRFLFLLLFIQISLAAVAQIQRKPAPAVASKDSAAISAQSPATNKRKELLKELDLSKEQKLKLRAIHQAAQAKKDAISNDDKLTEAEKKTRLRQLRMEQADSLMSILDEKQKAKFKTLRPGLNADE